MRLEVDILPEDAKQCEQLRLKQEGSPGLKIPLPFLPELLEALEKPPDSEVFYFWQNVGIKKTRAGCSFHVSTLASPLLQLSAEQCAKLSAFLKSNCSAYM